MVLLWRKVPLYDKQTSSPHAGPRRRGSPAEAKEKKPGFSHFRLYDLRGLILGFGVLGS